jgi:hypothetical protein
MSKSQSQVFDVQGGDPRGRLVWPVLLIAAWVAFEVTASPTVGVVVLCCKFGWNDLRTAIWLRAADSDTTRSGVCGVFHLAASLWKVSLAAVGAMFAIVAVQLIANGGHQGLEPPAEFVVATLCALIGPALATLTTWFAVALARRNSVKVWIAPVMNLPSEKQAWPPDQFGSTNQAGFLLIAAIVCPAGPLVVSPIAGACLLLEWVQNTLLVFPTLAAASVITMGIGRLALALKDKVAKTVIAVAPEECWWASR